MTGGTSGPTPDGRADDGPTVLEARHDDLDGLRVERSGRNGTPAPDAPPEDHLGGRRDDDADVGDDGDDHLDDHGDDQLDDPLDDHGDPNGVAQVDVDTLTRDLMALRKGRALQSPGLVSRLGPALVAALDLDLALPETELRRLAQSGIVEAAQALAGDLREAVLVSLAVDGWTNVPLLTDRIDAIATAMDRDARTARRRLDAATRQLADALVSRQSGEPGNPFAPTGWYVESLAATMRLDSASARLTEDRVIVADADGLDTVTATLSVQALEPGTLPELGIVAEAGCRIRGAHRVSESHWRYELALPRPLRAGERHRYVVSFTADRDRMRPHYVLIPLRRTRRFSAEIRFADADAVALAWRLDGVPPAVLEDAHPTTRTLTPDDTGVIRVRFEQVVQGLCYGVQWRWA
ncbi:hypothetical protein [Kineosporia sp. R_H_3]|uniref:hypothetical protein n=1 Tax=Kineosporia sp. R_H_3 TaxID=1961848 RepID=UPI000B4B5A0B|nr:hypothetical protein [Kineosporia sp. R_H_3]